MTTQHETTIGELMATDPLKLSAQDLDAIIEELRSQRHRFVIADDKKIGAPAARKSGAQTKREAAQKLVASDSAIADLLDGI